MYYTIEWVPDRTMESYIIHLENVIQIYQQAGFQVTTVSCNHEYSPLMTHFINKFGIKANYASAQEHIPEAECNNQVIKECIRAGFHALPFKAIPKIMIKYLAMEATQNHNVSSKRWNLPIIQST